jgi:thiamine biosynthesis lipoprotein
MIWGQTVVQASPAPVHSPSLRHVTTDSSRRQFLTGRVAARPLAPSRPLPREEATVRLETEAMACFWAVILNPGPAEQVMLATDALDEVRRVERLLTVFRQDSPVVELNRTAADAPATVTPELFALLLECRKLYDQTEGAFDPASQALLELWRACRRADRIPTQTEIDAALQGSGFSHVQLLDAERSPGDPQPRVAFDVQGVGLNFGAIGKGYAIDRAAAVLRARGMDEFLIHGGRSSLYASGGHAGQAGWPVGLKNPLFTEASYLTLLLHDQALGTSGSNVQYFRHGGRRYGHILDPRTGWPAQSLLSVSVVAPTAAQADALSTAFYVLGLEKARQYCDTHSSVGAILTPPPERGKRLSPLVCNLPEEQVFPVSAEVEVLFAESTPPDSGLDRPLHEYHGGRP